MSRKKLSRRDFLRSAGALAGLAVAGTLAGGCQPKVIRETVIVEKAVEKVVKEVVKETVIVAGTPKVVEKVVTKAVPATPKVKKIRMLMDAWMRAITPMDRVTADYNEAHPDVHFTIEDAVGAEWETKLVAQVRAGDPSWCGHMGHSFSIAKWAELDIVVPIQDFLEASSEPGAAEIEEDFHPLPKAICTYKDELYGVSWRLDVVACTYNKKFCEAVGMEKWPQTWEGIEELAAKIKKEFADQNVWGMQLSRQLHHGAGAIFYTWEKKPWRDDGILDVLNPKFIEALQLLKKWQDMEICPTPPWQDQGGAHMTLFEGGKAGFVIVPHIWGKWAMYVLGSDVVSFPEAMPPTGGKTPAWAFPSFIFKNAPYAQEAMDFVVHVMGPKNERMIKSCIEGRGMPCYLSAFENIVPKVKDMGWQADLIKFMGDATPMAQTTIFNLQRDKILAKTEDYLLDKIPDPKAAMEQALKEITDEAAKQQIQIK